MPMNVGAAITPAINHTGRVLFKPFILRNWLALGFVSILAASGGGVSVPSSNPRGPATDVISQWIAEHLALVIVGFVALFILGIVLSWLGAVLKFVYLVLGQADPSLATVPTSTYPGPMPGEGVGG